MALLCAGLLAGSVGCATNQDVSSLRAELTETRKIAEDAQRQAAAASADAATAKASAEAAAAEAAEASEKADRIFQKTLRK
jgi:hypothetical protein